MKKSIVFCLCMAVVALFSACNRDQGEDGVFNPSKKLQKIYLVGNGVQNLQQVWNWNGDLLSSIDFYSDGIVSTTNSFYYDGNRLTTMRNESSYATFSYDGEKIDHIDVFQDNDNEPLVTYSFEYKGSKVGKVRVVIDYDHLTNEKVLINPLKFLLPQVCDNIEHLVANRMKETKGGNMMETLTMELTWTGDNITKVRTSGFSTAQEVTRYSYDNKENPFKGFLGMYAFNTTASGAFCGNKNNVLTSTSKKGSISYSSRSHYEYEDNYPVKETQTFTLKGEPMDDSISFVYEY